MREFKQCPACEADASASTFLFPISQMGNDSEVLRCSVCSLIYKRMFLDEEELKSLYGANYGHFAPPKDSDLDPMYKSYDHKLRILRQKMDSNSRPDTLGGGSLLDIGCGSGQFVAFAKSKGYKAYGIDPFLPEENVSENIRRATPEKLPEDFPDTYDVITLFNVFEHLTVPRQLMRLVRKLANPGTALLLTCPYGNALARRTYTSSWRQLAFEEHLLFWTPRAFAKLFADFGFKAPSSFVAGSPFPFGYSKTKPRSAKIGGAEHVENIQSKQPKRRPLNYLRIALLRQPVLASMVRGIGNYALLGDYMLVLSSAVKSEESQE